MNIELPAEAQAFGESAAAAFNALGGVDVARRCEAGEDRGRVTDVLERLGVDDLQPWSDEDEAWGAAELCRVAGTVALPFPIVAHLLRRDDHPLALAPTDGLRVDHGAAFPEWRVATLAGSATNAVSESDPLATKLGPFVSDLEPTEPAHVESRDVDLHLTFSSWVLLGMLERALELAVAHVKERVQFGQPLAKLQAVQFQLADAKVTIDGLRELCRFTHWRVQAVGAPARADALALRWYALDSAVKVLRTTQQLHGASGLCDEYDISIICRHAQPYLRLPFGIGATTAALVESIAVHGFEGLFPHGADAR